jgi:DNA-binding transcriptional LysR family regulator
MLEELRTFVLFAEEGSIQKVAQRLPLTQPAVSRQIQRLEQVLGVPLLDRRQKPPSLTPMGVQALDRCREILEGFAQLKSMAATPEPEGVFRLGLVNGLSDASLAERVAAVIARFPRLSLRLKSGWSNELAEQHRMGMLDAAIILADEDVCHPAQSIGQESLVAIGARGLAAAPDKWKRLGWILSPEPCDGRRSLVRRLALDDRPLVVTAEIEHQGLQTELVRQGVGLGLMPERLLGAPKATGIEPIIGACGTLRFNVLLLRSPHLGQMGKVADAIAEEMGERWLEKTTTSV